MKESQPKPLGMYLLEAKLITQKDLNVALKAQKTTGKRLGDILVMLGLIKRKTIEYFIEKIVLPEQQKLKKINSYIDNNKSKQSAVVDQAHLIESIASPDFHIYISAQKTVKFLLGVVLCLVLLNLFASFARYHLPDYPSRELFQELFNLDGENNIPSLYSAGSLLFCSILLAIIYRAKKIAGIHNFRWWAGLSIVFAYLSFDELVSIHEKLTLPLRNTYNARGLLYFSWIIAGAIFILAFLLIFWRFITTLPKKTRRLFFIAGTIYVAGAIGSEMVGGYYVDQYTYVDMIYVLVTTIEEMLEMLGVIVFIYALLSYMSSYMNGVDVGVHIMDFRKQRQSL